MGLFNTIICEYKLPQLPPELEGKESIDFQTKDLDPLMKEFLLKEDGELYENVREYELVPCEDKTKIFFPFHQELISEELVRQSNTGLVNFYASFERDGFELSGWVEYDAMFKGGKLIQIVDCKITEPRNYTDEEKEQRKKYKKEAEKRRERYNFFMSQVDALDIDETFKKYCRKLVLDQDIDSEDVQCSYKDGRFIVRAKDFSYSIERSSVDNESEEKSKENT